MGNSICCPNELSRQRGEVLVIKEDGASLRFKDGTPVKDILAAYPYHKIIRCSSERTVMSVETQLSCNWLYFLLPVGLALSEAAYQNLVRSAASRNLSANGIKVEDKNRLVKGKDDGGDWKDHDGRNGSFNDYRSTHKWKPILRTIPEITSPSN